MLRNFLEKNKNFIDLAVAIGTVGAVIVAVYFGYKNISISNKNIELANKNIELATTDLDLSNIRNRPFISTSGGVEGMEYGQDYILNFSLKNSGLIQAEDLKGTVDTINHKFVSGDKDIREYMNFLKKQDLNRQNFSFFGLVPPTVEIIGQVRVPIGPIQEIKKKGGVVAIIFSYHYNQKELSKTQVSFYKYYNDNGRDLFGLMGMMDFE